MCKCYYCGASEKDCKIIKKSKYSQHPLCNKHYMQLSKGGKIKRTRFDKNEVIIHNNYTEMKLYDSDAEEIGYTLIPKNMVEEISMHKWSLSSDGYVVNKKVGYLHRFITKCSDSDIIDHIDRNRLNNLHENLRLTTQHENSFNNSLHVHNKSGVTGVSYIEDRGKWLSQIMYDGKTKFLGRYVNKEDAIKARLKSENKYFGEFAPQKHLFEEYGIC